MTRTRPATSWGTNHEYCSADPSTKPSPPAGGWVTKAPVAAARGCISPRAGSHAVRQLPARAAKVRQVPSSPVAAAMRAMAKSASAYSSVVEAVPHTCSGANVWPALVVLRSKPT